MLHHSSMQGSLYRPGSCSTYFSVTLAGLKNIDRYIGGSLYRDEIYRGSTAMLSVFPWNVYTLGLHPQTQNLESPCTA